MFFFLSTELSLRMATEPVSSLTYGEVPWGYKEKVKALPLEPEQLYIVSMNAYKIRSIMPLKFVIRLNETGNPDRVEYLGWNALSPIRNYIGHCLNFSALSEMIDKQ